MKRIMMRILITAIEIALIVLAIMAVVTILGRAGIADELDEAYVICQPDDYVNVRMNPSRKSQVVGYADAGDRILTDGTKRNGFLKVYGIGEAGEGWIHAGYVVYDRPVKMGRNAVVVSNGRLAARKHIGGKRRCWLKNQDRVKVYWFSEEWCVTDKGFVKSRFIEMEGV